MKFAQRFFSVSKIIPQPSASSLESPRRLKAPFWRMVALVAAAMPIAIAIAVSQWKMPFPFPPTCLFQWVFGFPSPSCGLTRSFLALARGDWQTALSYHLFGPLVMVLIGAIALLSTIELITRRSFAGLYQRAASSSLKFPLIVLFGVYYGLRLWARYTLPALPFGFEDSALWQLFLSGALAL